MPMFHFNLRDGNILVEDNEGTDFRDLAAAVEEAVESACEMLAERVRNGKAIDCKVIEITDIDGGILSLVSLRDQLHLS